MSGLTAYDKHLARLAMVSFFLPLRVQVAIMLPLCAFWAVRDLRTGGRNGLRFWYVPLALGASYLLYAVYLPFTPKPHLGYLLSQLEYRVSILLLPFIFLLLRDQTKTIIRGQIPWFVIGSFASCVAGNIWYLSHYGWNTGAGNHVQYRLFFEGATGLHPTYMGMYLSLSIVWLLLHDKWRVNLRGWLVAFIFLCLFLFLLALLPKTPVIALALILLHYCWTNRANRQLVMQLAAGALAAILITWLFLPFSLQRMGELSALVQQGGAVAQNSISMRKLIWTIDIDLLEKHWLLGTGPGQLPFHLLQQYYFYSLLLRFPLGLYDTHNEYLNQWLSFGLAGLLVFLMVWVLHFRKAVEKKDLLYVYLLIILSITCFTENVLATQHGIVFYAFFTSLFYFGNKKEEAVTG